MEEKLEKIVKKKAIKDRKDECGKKASRGKEQRGGKLSPISIQDLGDRGFRLSFHARNSFR